MCCDSLMLVFIICVAVISVVVLAVGAWVCSFTWNRRPKGPDQVAALVTHAKEMPLSHMGPGHGMQQRSVAGIPFAPSPSDMMMPPPPPFHRDPGMDMEADNKQTPEKIFGLRQPGHTSHAMPPLFTPGQAGQNSAVYNPTPPQGPPGNKRVGGRLPPLSNPGQANARRLSTSSAVSDTAGGRQRRGSNASGTYQQQQVRCVGVTIYSCWLTLHCLPGRPTRWRGTTRCGVSSKSENWLRRRVTIARGAAVAHAVASGV